MKDSEAYPTELSSIMDLNHTISQVCGQFVVLDPQGRVTLVHHSAREYLRRTKRCPFPLNSDHANEELLFKCLATLCDNGLRRKLHTVKVPRFLPYASTSWAHHLESSSPDSDQVLDALAKFFSGPYPLAWIHSGSLLACYALSKTFVWKVADWSLAFSVDNPRQERAIEFKFDENDALMMISDHRRVYRLPKQNKEKPPAWEQQDSALLEEPGVTEGMFLSTPSCVAFNSDCTQIAVAYRLFPLSIWTVDPPEMIARLKRRSKHGQGLANSYTGDSKVVWHPSGAAVIGIYGKIFKWGPEDDTYEEVKDETGVVPHGLACSPNGQVFITMDVAGSIKIYDVSSMSLIYKLSSEDRINQIFFGTDTSESHAESRPAITAIDPGRESHGLLIAHGNEDGSINIYDTMGKQKYEVGKTMFKMTVEHFAWTPKQDRLAYSLTNGATTIMSVSIIYRGERAVITETTYSEKKSPTDRGRTRQLLFDATGNRLLVSGMKKCQVLAIPDGAVLAELQLCEDSESAKWQQHPARLEDLLCLSGQAVTVFSWDTLEKKSTISLDLSTHGAKVGDGTSALKIDAVLDSHSLRHLILRTVRMYLNRAQYNFAVLPMQDIYSPTAASSTSDEPYPPVAIKALTVPPSIASVLTHAIGILPDGRLVFLDRHLWHRPALT
ncbi:hypothetical protein VTI74DRAFT_4098 [Chaetomium olivicolor]